MPITNSQSGLKKVSTGKNHFSYVPKCNARNQKELDAYAKRVCDEAEKHFQEFNKEVIKEILTKNSFFQSVAKDEKPKKRMTNLNGGQSINATEA